ncbi:Glutathione S-transferase [Pseudomonas sp. NFACC15-1]|uniref:glutathione S-transferase n=1 Tax=unclassified Pseudomonas TaxID=196821 RepID=UPI000886DFE5|nr:MULTISPECIES: glutathione S-transferase [unclassified Pseudomonas]SDA59716.1 Glutathione S-transferase [Pseudomonas sp. NFACC15-1]SDX85741.1 Glutathione S-transferase [Pseudomonas sp. NFACC14]
MTSSQQRVDVSTVPTMKIYDWFNGPYPARVRIALAEKGLLPNIEFIPVNLWAGEHKNPEFLAINYSGTLPVLELDDGTRIAECTAITQYLDSLDGHPTLTGETPVEKGIIHMMTKRAEIEFLDAVSVYFHHATPGLGPDVELYQNAEWGTRMRDKAIRGMRYFDNLLKDQAFVAGDKFSMADIAVLGGMIFASLVQLSVPEECAALRAWHARMQERSSVQAWRAMVERGAA